MKKKIWVYGQPFSGKTTFACGAPKHFVLSTDGNAEYSTDSYKVIADEVKVEGRMTKRRLAWDVLKSEIETLERREKDYQTVILDLVEDTYEMCRLYMYEKLGIEHESDNSFKAWDAVRVEYLSTMRRFINLPYDVVLISHEDSTKDLTKKSGDKVTSIQPNISPKIANKLAGMVALVGRCTVDNGKYQLEIKPDEVVFGGGRLGVTNVSVPLVWSELKELFKKEK